LYVSVPFAGTAHPRSSPTLNTAGGVDDTDATRRAKETANTAAKWRVDDAIGMQRIDVRIGALRDRITASPNGTTNAAAALERKWRPELVLRGVVRRTDQCVG
jgi:hypothetical protein